MSAVDRGVWSCPAPGCRFTVRGLEVIDPALLAVLQRSHGRRHAPPAPPSPPRCVHGRVDIDPCIGCGRRYEGGELVGPFVGGQP